MATTTITVGNLIYDPKNILGLGNFGTVFSGFYVIGKSIPVAIRRTERGRVNESVIQQEEELMKKAIDHPNILRYIHTEMNSEFLYMATELCVGTLSAYVKGKYKGTRFKNEREILLQITEGLAHLHSLRIVHRDIKPNNILISVSPSTNEPQIKLADFNISKMLKATKGEDCTNTSMTNPSGSMGWMAPEVYESNRFDFKVDVWALGLIFGYTLSRGKHPFGDNPFERQIRIKRKESMVLVKGDLMESFSMDPFAFELIESMLAIDPEKRPTAVEVINNSLFFTLLASRTHLRGINFGEQTFSGNCAIPISGEPIVGKRVTEEEIRSSCLIIPVPDTHVGGTILEEMTTRVKKLSYDHRKDIIGLGGRGTTVFSGLYYENIPTSESEDENRKKVAIKRIQRSYLGDDESIVKQEVELMLKVGHHPNILRYIHSEMDINYLYIATELCKGTLEDFFNGKYDGLEKGIINKQEILRQVTKGLAHLHKLGIAHCNIKPTNILIFEPDSEAPCNNPQMKLADFDISKLFKTTVGGDLTNTGVTNSSGTWGWMAPEAYQSKQYDFKEDVWALGCIFGYTLSGGKHPFGDDDTLERIYRIKQKRDMLLTKNDLMEDKENNQAFDLIKSMLMVDPKIRPTVMDVLKNSFLRDWERTTKFLGLCESFRDSITNAKIIQFEELVKNETVDINVKSDNGYTPLHYLCRYYTGDNLLHFVELLLQYGSNVNAKNVSEQTPLHLLCYYYNNDNLIHIVKLLLEKGAQANVQDKINRDSPLFNLCSSYKKENMLDIVKLLVDNGADVNNRTNFFVYLFMRKRRNPLCILCQNYESQNLIDIVQYLIEKGANANAKNENGETPLHLLCRCYYHNNLVDVAQLLIQHGAIVNVKSKGSTPLHTMCYNYKKRNINLVIEIAQLLIKSGAKVNMKDGNGNTPLYYVCQHYKKEDRTYEKINLGDLITYLIEKGAKNN